MSFRFRVQAVIFATVALCTVVLVPVASAQNLGVDRVDDAAKNAGYAPANETTFAENVGSAIRILLSLLGIIFTILIIYAGYLWMTARGSEDNVTKAKDIISSSIIGLIILLMAYSITNFIVNRVIDGTINATSTTP